MATLSSIQQAIWLYFNSQKGNSNSEDEGEMMYGKFKLWGLPQRIQLPKAVQSLYKGSMNRPMCGIETE